MPWYDLPDIRRATDHFWSIVAKHMVREGVPEVPQQLDRKTPISVQWRHPRLLLTQACGYNVAADCSGWLRVLATPSFSAPGCARGRYRSLVVVREDSSMTVLEDLRGKRCVVNNISSHSGSNAFLKLIEPLRGSGSFFRSVRVSGAHVNSAQMVITGEADVASIDCITFELWRRHRRQTVDAVRVIATTEDAPAPPYVTRRSATAELVERLSTALSEAFADADSAEAREDMLLSSLISSPPNWYGELFAGAR